MKTLSLLKAFFLVGVLALQHDTVFGQLGGIAGQISDAVSKYDPTRRDSESPVHIVTPFKKPGFDGHGNGSSGFCVISYSVNLDGYVSEQTRTDLPYKPTNQRAQLQYFPSGRAFWVWAGKRYPAATKYDNLALQQEAKIAEERKAAEQQKANFIAGLVNVNQQCLQTPEQEMVNAVQSATDEGLNQAMLSMNSMIYQAELYGLQNVEGFKRYRDFVNSEINRRHAAAGSPVSIDTKNATHFAPNLGIQYEVVLFEKQHWGLKLTQNPAEGTPAATIGLEIGDIVLQLDGQYIDAESDVLNHVDDTSVLIVNVRDGSKIVRNVTLPRL